MAESKFSTAKELLNMDEMVLIRTIENAEKQERIEMISIIIKYGSMEIVSFILNSIIVDNEMLINIFDIMIKNIYKHNSLIQELIINVLINDEKIKENISMENAQNTYISDVSYDSVAFIPIGLHLLTRYIMLSIGNYEHFEWGILLANKLELSINFNKIFRIICNMRSRISRDRLMNIMDMYYKNTKIAFITEYHDLRFTYNRELFFFYYLKEEYRGLRRYIKYSTQNPLSKGIQKIKNIDTELYLTNLNLRFDTKNIDYANNGSFYYLGKPLKFKYNKNYYIVINQDKLNDMYFTVPAPKNKNLNEICGRIINLFSTPYTPLI